MIWEVPKIWEGGECWIIGGGPSMPEQFGVPADLIAAVQAEELSPDAYSPYLSPIHDKHIIGVNAAFLLGSWVDCMILGDTHFYFRYRTFLSKYHNLKISCTPGVGPRKHGVYAMKYVDRDTSKTNGISERPNKVSWNNNTGAAAINLAYHFGVKRVYLLGFDMKLSDTNKQHWHGIYPTAKDDAKKRKLPFTRHLPSYAYIKADARKLGLEIINVSPNSAIEHFPRVHLKDIL